MSASQGERTQATMLRNYIAANSADLASRGWSWNGTLNGENLITLIWRANSIADRVCKLVGDVRI